VSTPISHAQFAEDRVLAEIFGERANGHCVEVGANDGVTGSASYLFERRGWQCLLVEPIPAMVQEIRRHRSCQVVNCAASSSEGEATFLVAEGVEAVSGLDLTPERQEWIRQLGGTIKPLTVRTATLDRLLADAGFTELDFVTIDVEGHELSVLEGFDLDHYRPRIVIIEDNSIAGNASVARHMTNHGYVHFKRTGVNEWYAHESDAELVKSDELRKFERTKKLQLWDRKRRKLANRVATWGGRYLPEPTKRRLRDATTVVLRKRASDHTHVPE
jgi:FkbM family methyltransferase